MNNTITIEHTCIKKKGKGIYKNSLTSTVATEETPNEQPTNNPIPVYPDHTDSDNPDFDHAPVEIDSPDYMTIEEMREFTQRSKLCREDYSKYLVVYPETDSQESHDHDIKKDFESITDDDSDYLLKPLTTKEWQLLRNHFFEVDNPHDTILESTYFPDSDKLVVFGVPPRGDLLNQYCLWQYENGITNLITIGKKEAVKQRYEDYCKDEKAFFILPKPTTPYLEEFKTRLEPDGRYFPKKQLSLFGE